MATPALYPTVITHTRRSPSRHQFQYRSYSWYVDIDHLPVLPTIVRPFAKFRAQDHFQGPGTTLRQRLDSVLAAAGIASCPQVTALLSARVLGHGFTPLSLFWCCDSSGELRCVVAEVHNTYGGRHSYVVVPGADSRATATKCFYVSPFHDVRGEYTMRLPQPAARLSIMIRLHQPGQQPFTATMTGRRMAATTWNIVAAQLRYPLAPLVVSARIRRQGLALWLRGLQIYPRPRKEHP